MAADMFLDKILPWGISQRHAGFILQVIQERQKEKQKNEALYSVFFKVKMQCVCVCVCARTRVSVCVIVRRTPRGGRGWMRGENFQPG